MTRPHVVRNSGERVKSIFELSSHSLSLSGRAGKSCASPPLPPLWLISSSGRSLASAALQWLVCDATAGSSTSLSSFTCIDDPHINLFLPIPSDPLINSRSLPPLSKPSSSEMVPELLRPEDRAMLHEWRFVPQATPQLMASHAELDVCRDWRAQRRFEYTAAGGDGVSCVSASKCLRLMALSCALVGLPLPHSACPFLLAGVAGAYASDASQLSPPVDATVLSGKLRMCLAIIMLACLGSISSSSSPPIALMVHPFCTPTSAAWEPLLTLVTSRGRL
mmetsp:Transcript_16431/g.32122  ORF Transcript_16431/g.32122 Transcript_16431/m.32122 type:complete len:278 (+) Transcript_16431:767-1600(+)